MKEKKDYIYKEPETMLKKPKDFKRNTTNLPDMKKVEQYFKKKR